MSSSSAGVRGQQQHASAAAAPPATPSSTASPYVQSVSMAHAEAAAKKRGDLIMANATDAALAAIDDGGSTLDRLTPSARQSLHNRLSQGYSASSSSSLSSSMSSLQDTATSIPTPNPTSSLGTPKSVNHALQSTSNDKHTQQNKLSPALSVSSSLSYRDIGGVSDHLQTDSSSVYSGSVANHNDSVSTLQRELHFAAEIGQYLLEQNQELERALAECRNEGEWLRSVLSQVDKAALTVLADGQGDAARQSLGSSGRLNRLSKGPRKARLRSSQDDSATGDYTPDQREDDDYGISSSSEPRSVASVSDLDAPDVAAHKLYALREEYALVKREAHLRLRRLQRSQAEADALKHEIEALNIELSDLREENRLAALEHNRLRASHAEDIERLKKLVSEPRKRFAELEAIISTSHTEKSALSERLRESTQEVDELRLMLNDARETIDGYKVELESKGDISRNAVGSHQIIGTSHAVTPLLSSVAVQTQPYDFGSLERGLSRRVTFSLPTTPSASNDGINFTSESVGYDGEMEINRNGLGDGSEPIPSELFSTQGPMLSPSNQLVASRNIVPSSDISTIVRLMVGAWLLKYNKRRSKAERRFVMVNPYTRTISWSKRDPSDEKNDGVSTVYIQSVHVEDLTDGRSRIVIIAPTREVVFECRSAAEHEIWERGLTLILQNHRGAIQRTLPK
ncbi:hypothetical protein HDU67_000698 [Dinochytrium kinnereticum]|nr:hypothetical protein HDU67_000698 [Dinochytrium kinnereticum]